MLRSTLLSALAIALVWAGLPLSARGVPPTMGDAASFRITVPFVFTWEGREFRAGDYRVDIRSCTPLMVMIQRVPTRGVAAMIETHDWLSRGDYESPWRLVFRSTCTGTQCRFELLELRWNPVPHAADSSAGSSAYDACVPGDSFLVNTRIRFD